MISKMFAIKDRKATFWHPFTAVNEHVAKRDFAISVNREPNMRDLAPDLELYMIGSFDDATAEVSSKVEYLCSALDVLEVTE